jgi:hypothetical protein
LLPPSLPPVLQTLTSLSSPLSSSSMLRPPSPSWTMSLARPLLQSSPTLLSPSLRLCLPGHCQQLHLDPSFMTHQLSTYFPSHGVKCCARNAIKILLVSHIAIVLNVISKKMGILLTTMTCTTCYMYEWRKRKWRVYEAVSMCVYVDLKQINILISSGKIFSMNWVSST